MADAPSNQGPKIWKLPIPLFGDVNSRRFYKMVGAGALGGAGVSAAASLLRSYLDLREKRRGDETDEDTIVLTLPSGRMQEKDGSAGPSAAFDGMRDAKPGERKVTARGGTQMRENGRFGKGISTDQGKPTVKSALTEAVPDVSSGGPDLGPNSVGTIVADTLGFAGAGLVSYELLSRVFDKIHEHRLKKRLAAAQNAYISALSGQSKRAEAVSAMFAPVEAAVASEPAEKRAGKVIDLINWISDRKSLQPGVDLARYPTAAYLLALLAGTGATAYVTKKVMDREFPEEKLKKDVNRPARIVFKTAEDGSVFLAEGEPGQEKRASDETCAALAAVLPIYMDVVEGVPNRTLSAPYVKIAEANETDPAGLMKIAAAGMWQAIMAVLKDPRALWEVLKGTNFGLNYSHANALNILKRTRPATYSAAQNAMLDANGFGKGGKYSWAGNMVRNWSNDPNHAANYIRYRQTGNPDDLFPSNKNDSMTDAFGKWVGRNLVRWHGGSTKQGEDDKSFLHSSYLGDVVFGGGDGEDAKEAPMEEKDIVAKAKKQLKGRRGVRVSAADPAAGEYLRKNKKVVRALLQRLNATGTI